MFVLVNTTSTTIDANNESSLGHGDHELSLPVLRYWLEFHIPCNTGRKLMVGITCMIKLIFRIQNTI